MIVPLEEKVSDDKSRLVRKYDGYGKTDFWVVDERNDTSKIDIVTENGKYNISSAEGRMMSFTEEKVLSYIIHCYVYDYKMAEGAKMKFNAKDILINAIGYDKRDPNGDDYKRVFAALDLIKGIKIRYEYDNYKITRQKPASYGIIMPFRIDPDNGEIILQLDTIFEEQVRTRKDFHVNDLDIIKKFTPAGAKMYQVLLEVLKNEDKFKDDIRRFAKRLTWKNSDKVKPSVLNVRMKDKIKEVNKCGTISVDMKYDEKDKTVEFQKKGEKAGGVLAYNIEYLDSILGILPDKIRYHVEIKDIIKKYINQAKVKQTDIKDYMASNAKYACEKAKKDIWAYFMKSLENDWGAAIRAEWLAKEIAEKNILIENEKKESNRRKEFYEREMNNYINNAINYLYQNKILDKNEIEEKAKEGYLPSMYESLKSVYDRKYLIKEKKDMLIIALKEMNCPESAIEYLNTISYRQ